MIDDEFIALLQRDAYNHPKQGIKIPPNKPNLIDFTEDEIENAGKLIEEEINKISTNHNLPS